MRKRGWIFSDRGAIPAGVDAVPGVKDQETTRPLVRKRNLHMNRTRPYPLRLRCSAAQEELSLFARRGRISISSMVEFFKTSFDDV